jgi:prepilin-type N-terminal cleavage/methylation domain-containing protein
MMGVPNFGRTKELVMRLNRNPTPRACRLERRVAFTLVEMMIVVAIIVLLAGVGTYYMAGAIDEGNQSKAKADVKSITDAATIFKAQHGGRWPQSIDELFTPPDDGGPTTPYLKSVEAKLSPWGGLYQYDPSGPGSGGLYPDVYCVMPNGKKIVNYSTKLQ